jgi:uroporphyrinogen III methyltransferase/synthase
VTVYLVGAGPGDPDLITVRGADLLRAADVVVYDRLSARSLLDLAPESAERIDVGKSAGGPGTGQDDINALLIERGRSGQTIVRLKGGDPFVFARGGEEAAALEAAGISYEVVPGITSAIAVPAYAGIPVTKRFSSTSLTIVTGHEDPTKDHPTVDWESIARLGGTIVILMGAARIGDISKRLIAGGLAASTPVAAIRWGTRSTQTTVRSDLGSIGDESLAPPVTIVVGDVAAERLEWFERRPLFGRSVVVTRTRTQASVLTDALRAEGADVIEFPTIEFAEPLDGGALLRAAAEQVGDYDWVVLTSPNGAERFCDAISDGRALGGVKLAVMGTGTAAVLQQRFLEPDLVPESFVAESLLDSFPPAPVDGGRVLIARAEVARDVLLAGLRAAGWTVDVVDAYRTVAATPDAEALDRLAAADIATFTSSSTVTRFLEVAGADRLPSTVACIGPITAQTARDAGITVDVEAAEHSIPGLVASLVEWATNS